MLYGYMDPEGSSVAKKVYFVGIGLMFQNVQAALRGPSCTEWS